MTASLNPKQRRAAAVAAFAGNLVVWYDFALYGYLASQLGQAFFPDDSPQLRLLASFGVFAVGFLMRPVGSVVLGPLGDLLGRRLLLSVCTVIMGVSCLLIALLPTHAQLGLLATTALVVLRMLQGVAVGADLTGSISTATEAAGNANAGLLSSLVVAGGHLGFCLSSLVVGLTSLAVQSSALEPDWAWRFPFLLGALATAVGLWMRQRMPETLPPLAQTPAFTRPLALLQAIVRHLREALGEWRLGLQVIALVSFANVCFYQGFFYLVDVTAQRSGATFAANTIATLVQGIGLLLALAGGLLVDRFGMVPVNRWGTLAMLLVTPLAMHIGQQGTLVALTAALGLLVGPVMVSMGALGALGAVLVPPRQRCAVFSIAYALASALFAGTAPLVSSWLTALHADWAVPLYALPYGCAALIAIDASRHAGLR